MANFLILQEETMSLIYCIIYIYISDMAHLEIFFVALPFAGLLSLHVYICTSLISYLFCIASQAYPESKRSQWVCDWPGQVVLCTSQIYWTLEVHDAIRSGINVRKYSQYHTQYLPLHQYFLAMVVKIVFFVFDDRV